MSVLDIQHLLNYPPKNRVRLCGCELEGGWSSFPPGHEVLWHHDASVKGLTVDPSGKAVKSGEITSPPMYPAAMGKWVKLWYPHVWNSTCGLHIHMSFHQIRHYRRLMVEDYQDTMLAYLKQWCESEGNFPHAKPCPHVTDLSRSGCPICMGTGTVPGHHIWDRFAGKCKHCSLKFWPDKQVAMVNHGDLSSPERFTRDGSRYTMTNYCFNVDNRQTLEIRVLPMMDTAEQSVRALKQVVRITNAVLYVLRHDTRQDRATYSLPAVDLKTPIVDEEVLVL